MKLDNRTRHNITELSELVLYTGSNPLVAGGILRCFHGPGEGTVFTEPVTEMGNKTEYFKCLKPLVYALGQVKSCPSIDRPVNPVFIAILPEMKTPS
jgi:hypothetical protein